MNDARIIFEEMQGDIKFTADDLEAEKGLETAVIISLFTDARSDGQRGWWADALEGDNIGSKLWLLSREKLSQDVRTRAEEYARESLQWMIDDQLAQDVTVLGEIRPPDRLDLLVTITRPDDKTESFRFNNIWEQQKLLR